MKNVIFKCIAGSRMFGVHNQFSDYDYKAVYLLPLEDRNENQPKAASVNIISPEEGGEEYFHFEAFIRLIKEGQTIPFEMLFCPKENIIKSSPLWEKLVANRHLLVHKNITAFYGMAEQQAMKYSEKGNRIQAFSGLRDFLATKPPHIKLKDMQDEIYNFVLNAPYVSYRTHKLIDIIERRTNIGLEKFVVVCETKLGYSHKISSLIQILDKQLSVYGKRSIEAFKNDAIDYKALSHCVRVAVEAKELLLDHKITLPLK
jgi:predicted nucleotidyltransferase